MEVIFWILCLPCLLATKPLLIIYNITTIDTLVFDSIYSISNHHRQVHKEKYNEAFDNSNISFANYDEVIWLKDVNSVEFKMRVFLYRNSSTVPESLPVYNGYQKYVCLSDAVYRWLQMSSKHLLSTYEQTYPIRTKYLECLGPRAKIQSSAKSYLNGRKIKIATINRPPFLIFEMGGKNNKEIIKWKGYCIDMLNAIAEKYNFSYTLQLPPDGNWGIELPNGSFNGMVGMVIRKEVDLAIASFTITHKREQVADMTHAFYIDPTAILIPQPQEMKDLFAFMAPYTWQVWLTLFASATVVSTVVWLSAKTVAQSGTFLYPWHKTRITEIQPATYFITISSALVGQGYNFVKHTNGSRIIHGFWLLFTLIIMFSYTGTLMSFLTVPKVTNLINSLEELSMQSSIKWSFRANTAYDNLFEKTDPPGTYSRIGEPLRENPNQRVQTDEEGVEAVLSQNMAYIKEKSWLDFAMEDDFLRSGECRLALAPKVFYSAGFGWILPENSGFLSPFNNMFLRMRQMGLFQYWKQRYWPRPNECTGTSLWKSRRSRALSLDHMKGHFIFLGCGLIIAFLSFLLELTKIV